MINVTAKIWDDFTEETTFLDLQVPMFTYEDCRLALRTRLGVDEPWEHLHSRMDSDGRALRIALAAELVPGQVSYSIEQYFWA